MWLRLPAQAILGRFIVPHGDEGVKEVGENTLLWWLGFFLMHSAEKLKDFAAEKAELFSSLSREGSPPQAWAALE